jgi:hypothetical protein
MPHLNETRIAQSAWRPIQKAETEQGYLSNNEEGRKEIIVSLGIEKFFCAMPYALCDF